MNDSWEFPGGPLLMNSALSRASLVAQMVNRLPAMPETWVGKIPWRRKWQPTPVLLPGKLHGLRRLVGYSPWGRKEPWLSHLHGLSFCTFTAEYLGSVPGWGTKTPQAVPLNKKTQSPSELRQIWKIHLNTEVSRNSKGIIERIHRNQK